MRDRLGVFADLQLDALGDLAKGYNGRWIVLGRAVDLGRSAEHLDVMVSMDPGAILASK